jgi:hypothetical protein
LLLFSRSFGFDTRITHSGRQGSECQIHSTSLAKGARNSHVG